MTLQRRFKKIFFLYSFFFLLHANGQTVTTLAGSTSGYTDGTGVVAQLNNVNGVAVDAAGNVYAADTFNHRIRKITPTGVVTTLAGSYQGYADGTGTSAYFRFPDAVAVDASGNVFVADTNNHRIRKITPDGVVTTIAGNSLGYADGIGEAAQFNYPCNLALDAAGTLYVADTYNNRIRKITPTGVVTTLAGSTQGFADGIGTAAQFNWPFGLTVTTDGTVFVSDTNNARIRKITPAGEVSTFAGSTVGNANGTGTAAQFYTPISIAADGLGTLYVADQNNHRVRKITAAGVVSTYAGSSQGAADGIGTSAQFNHLYGVALDAAGNVYVGDQLNHRIRKIAPMLATTQYQLEDQIKVYPNPAKMVLHIGLQDLVVANIKLYDMYGREVLTEDNLEETVALPIGQLPNGMYVIQIVTDKGTVCKKIVKQ